MLQFVTDLRVARLDWLWVFFRPLTFNSKVLPMWQYTVIMRRDGDFNSHLPEWNENAHFCVSHRLNNNKKPHIIPTKKKLIFAKNVQTYFFPVFYFRPFLTCKFSPRLFQFFFFLLLSRPLKSQFFFHRREFRDALGIFTIL